MNDELEHAARVHYSFLPQRHENDWLHVAARVMPKSVLGGDYCSVIPLDDRRFAACICDATGHGLASALYAARINTFVLTHILQGHDPCSLITELNRFLCRGLTGSGMYASFFVVLLDAVRMEMQYAGAGHPAVLHQSVADNRINWLESTTTLLGIGHPLPVACSLQQVPIRHGDRILLYSDGLTEARNDTGADFGRPGLATWFETEAGVHEDRFVDQLCTSVHDYSRGKLQDDVLCLGIRLKPRGRA
jgi:sigma-B regulation protein RsbU (phosphoserine phosphatase)